MKSSIFHRIFVLCLALSIAIPISLINVEKAQASSLIEISISEDDGESWTSINDVDGYNAIVSVEYVQIRYTYNDYICEGTPGYTNGDEIECNYDTFILGLTVEEDIPNIQTVSVYPATYTVTVTRLAEPVAPTVTTVAASDIDTDSATVSGKLYSNGGSDIMAIGIVYSTSEDIPLELDADTTKPYQTEDLANVEDYSINLTGLAPGVEYYYQAFAINEMGTSLGEKLQFTTSRLKPTITSIADVIIYKNNSTDPLEFTIGDPQYEEGGEYSYSSVSTSYENDNGQLVDGEGITINGTDRDRTITVTPISNETGEVIVTVTVTNQNNDTVTTNFKVTVLDTILIPMTTSVADITGTSAVVHASVTDGSDVGIAERGVVYSSIHEIPTVIDDTTVPEAANTAGDYSTSLIDLAHNTTYYVRAYASNEDGTVYGDVLSFTTLPQLTSFSFATPDATGTINEQAKTVAITVPYDTDVEHLIASFSIIGASVYVGGIEQITGETENNFANPLGLKVYAKDNETNVVYTVTVTVAPEVFPLVATTTSVDNITGTSAVVHASVTDESNVGIGERGVVYSSIHEIPTVDDMTVAEAANTAGDYSISLSNLARNTTYYVRAYTGNEDGPVYGAVQSFTTLPQLTAFIFTTPAATGTINEAAKTVAITVPYGTNVEQLIASFSIIGESFYVEEVEQSTDITENDYTNPLALKVFAMDGITHVVYTVTVTVADRISNDLPTPTPTPTPAPTPAKEIITVNVEDSGSAKSGVISTVIIERTTQSNGTKKDDVVLSDEEAKKTVDSMIAAGSKSASIVIPDSKDEVSEVNVAVPKSASKQLADAKIGLGISTDNVKVIIPNESLEGFNDDLFFKFIPIKKEAEKQEVKTRASNEAIVKIVAGGNEISIVGRPMTIETNMQSRAVTLVMPLGDVNLSEDELKDLGIFIEHSDGTKELLRGILVPFNDDGDLGLQFTVIKFSTFTLVHIEGLAEEQPHTAYMRGYIDGTFKPQNNITRAEMAAILSRVIFKEANVSNTAYIDVPSTHWAQSAISKVTTMGLMKGYSDGTFGPEKSISRAEMSYVINLLNDDPTKPGAGFSDIAGHWAEAAILQAQGAGLISGYEGGVFNPNDSLTRAETVTIMNKVLARGPLAGIARLPWSDVPSSHWAILDIAEASVDHSYELDVDGEQWRETP